MRWKIAGCKRSAGTVSGDADHGAACACRPFIRDVKPAHRLLSHCFATTGGELVGVAEIKTDSYALLLAEELVAAARRRIVDRPTAW